MNSICYSQYLNHKPLKPIHMRHFQRVYKLLDEAERILRLHAYITNLMSAVCHIEHGKKLYEKCQDCGKYFPKTDMEDYDCDYYCEDCYHNNFSTCGCCGEVYPNDNVTYVDIRRHDGCYCDRCFNDNFFYCSDCGRIGLNDENYHGRCSNCDSNYSYCDCCGEQCNDLDDHFRCPDCRPDETYIHDYGYKPGPIFCGNDSCRYIGQEIEVISKADAEKKAEEITNLFQQFVYCKHDGSLDHGGIELVTHPATYEWLKKGDFFTKIGGIENIRGYKYECCGHHIHISRKSESTLTWAKVILFVALNQEFCEAIGQRKFNRYCGAEYCEKAVIKAKYGSRDRYTAINVTRSTVEFRFFKSNLIPNRIEKNVQFVLALTDYCREAGLRDMDAGTFITWLQYTEYKILKRFIKKYVSLKNKEEKVCVSSF